MAYEPRPIPDVPGGILQSYWYCLECGYGNSIRASVANHWKAQHNGDGQEQAVESIDIARGSEMLQMQIRRNAWIKQEGDRFAAMLHEGFTADDFIAEAEIHTHEEVPVSPLEEPLA